LIEYKEEMEKLTLEMKKKMQKKRDKEIYLTEALEYKE
jgi:hypothetical protein